MTEVRASVAYSDRLDRVELLAYLRRAALAALRLDRQALPPAEDDPMAEEVAAALQAVRRFAGAFPVDSTWSGPDDPRRQELVAAVAAVVSATPMTVCAHLAVVGPIPTAHVLMLDTSEELCTDCASERSVAFAPRCAWCSRRVAGPAELSVVTVGPVVAIGTTCGECA